MSAQSQWITFISLTLSSWVLVSVVPHSNAAKILFVVYPQPSHVISKVGIAVDLIRQGHEVHIALPAEYPQKEALTRAGIQTVLHRQIPEVQYPYTTEYENTMYDLIYHRLPELNILKQRCHDICRSFMEDRGFIDRLRNENYNLLLIEPFAVYPCYLVVPHYLGVPFVSVTAIIIPFTYRLPALPTFFPAHKQGPEIENFPTFRTLRERIYNSVVTAVSMFLVKYFLWSDTTLLQRYAPGEESWEQLLLRTEILLVENDHLLDKFLPSLPHVVTVAGCSVHPAQPLPESVEKVFAQSGDDGVILATFGTSAHRMPSNIAIKFLGAFGRLKQKVLTKMAVPPGIQVPENVQLLSWLPQNDILGHPKTKLFITHCGSNGQYEALYHGVPMLGIPMFAEQGWNCARARHRGIALCLDLLQFKADELYDTVRELIDNITYRSNVEKLSAIFREQPMDGCKKAAFWINHVIKFGGSHLRSPALDQHLYQFLMFDVIAITLIVTVAIIVGVFFICTRLLKSCRKQSPKSKKD